MRSGRPERGGSILNPPLPSPLRDKGGNVRYSGRFPAIGFTSPCAIVARVFLRPPALILRPKGLLFGERYMPESRYDFW
jgi:hypothetical protein